jgi:hypothetical protein
MYNGYVLGVSCKMIDDLLETSCLCTYLGYLVTIGKTKK